MAQLIITADDFGRSIERNRAIDDSFKQGLIYSAGLIVTGKYLQNAVEYMNKGGYVDKVHLHVNLSTCYIDDDPEDIPLSDSMKNESFFCINGKFKKYRGLPKSFVSIRKWRVVYHEIVAQYNKFIEVTQGRGNYNHIDFHLWYNHSWPVSVALNVFTRKYKIKTVRYISMYKRKSIRCILYRIISWNPHVKSIPSASIDYYLTNIKELDDKRLCELYCHPNYREGVLLDDTPSYFHHNRQPLADHCQMLEMLGTFEFVSWQVLS